MLTFVRGNLFESPAKVLVNTVNTVGVMGKGIALTFKQIYPEMFKQYQSLCESRRFDIGNLWLYKTENKWILNFPTKRHWRNPSTLEYIETGLQKFANTYAEHGITSIAFPELGCGNGELEWATVRPLMVKHLKNIPINVYIYSYDRQASVLPEHRDVATMKRWLRTDPHNLGFDEFWSDLSQRIGSGQLKLRSSDGSEFAAEIVRYGEEGLLLHTRTRGFLRNIADYLRDRANTWSHRWKFTAENAVYVPKGSLLDLWQSIRSYGFCFRRTMPDGLDLLAEYLIPLLAGLPYLKVVQVSASSDESDVRETALQLTVTERSEPTVGRQLELIPA
jgi:O-acetyl-ADP-ribose deacetylase (regulator of RNase III)